MDSAIARAHDRRVKILALGLVVAANVAHADERSMQASVGGVMQVGSTSAYETMESEGGGRLALSWELPRLAMPDTPGYRLDVSLVPELHVVAMRGEGSIEGAFGAGLRGEVRMAQREMGLFRISAGGAFYAALRGSVVGETRDPQLELVAGEYLYLGRHTRTRIGFEGGYFERRDDMADAHVQGFVGQVYLGFGL